MSYVKELIRNEENGAVSFGDYSLPEKKKLADFKSGDDMLKVKTFKDLTRLEKNDMVVYESIPGTAVFNFVDDGKCVSFNVCADEDVQITLGLEENTEYSVYIDDVNTGKMKTNMSGKLSISIELAASDEVSVRVVR